jgi:hypothetical protein
MDSMDGEDEPFDDKNRPFSKSQRMRLVVDTSP